MADHESLNGKSTTSSFDPSYFQPLTEKDEYATFEVQLQVDSGGKAEVLVRTLNSSRIIYKAERTSKSNLLGKKKNINVVVYRSGAWDSVKDEPLPQESRAHTYVPIIQGFEQTSRSLSVRATNKQALTLTTHGSEFTVATHCGPYDSQRPRPTQPRDSLAHHFFPIRLSPPWPERYVGGGYCVFDCHSQGRGELLTTLYCTRYEERHRVRPGDIALAELRLPGDVDPTQSTWARFFKERHAVLRIFRRGAEAAFHGPHIDMSVSNPTPGSRYSLTPGQGHEIVISTVCMMLLSIEADRLEKRWQWMTSRTSLERMLSKGTLGVQDLHNSEIGSIMGSASSVREIRSEVDSETDFAYPPSVLGESMVRTTSPVSENTTEEPFTPVDGAYPPARSYAYHPQGYSEGSGASQLDSEVAYYQDLENKDAILHQASGEPPFSAGHPSRNSSTRRPLTGSILPIHFPIPVHPASLTSWAEDTRPETEAAAAAAPVTRKEGPKVTGRPKPGVEGGIYW